MFRSVSLLMLIAALSHTASAQAAGPQVAGALDRVHAEVEADHPGVVHITAGELRELDASQTLVFDVREAREYAVSRIAGAVRLDPSVTLAEFVREHADAVEGKTVVLYCSVGRRSSRLAEALDGALSEHGAAGVRNLAGGIFHWANTDLPLVTPSGADTTKVHPFNPFWGRLVADPEDRAYRPEN